MIYSVENGDRGKVFSNGVEIDLVLRVDTETGECLRLSEPIRAENGETVKETIILENVRFDPL